MRSAVTSPIRTMAPWMMCWRFRSLAWMAKAGPRIHPFLKEIMYLVMRMRKATLMINVIDHFIFYWKLLLWIILRLQIYLWTFCNYCFEISKFIRFNWIPVPSAIQLPQPSLFAWETFCYDCRAARRATTYESWSLGECQRRAVRVFGQKDTSNGCQDQKRWKGWTVGYCIYMYLW